MMVGKNSLFEFSSYGFLFAHPDDDVYCCVLMKRLADAETPVEVLFATSGDAGGRWNKREKETLCSMDRIGIGREHVHFLRVPELELAKDLGIVVDSALRIMGGSRPACIVGHDYEGGHEGHDLVSFCCSEAARLAGVGAHIIFPVYHGPPGKRRGARFKPGRLHPAVLPFSREDRRLKEAVLACYGSQREHFEELGVSSSDYFDLLFSRELYIRVSTPLDYREKPMDEIGYESHRNRFTFEAFQTALDDYRTQQHR
jgi:LmbE family N-acetylglucosaminyl deacetylase